MRIDHFCDEVKYFIKSHKVLCAMTLGLAIAGYALGNLAGRAVVWLSQCCGSAEKTDRVAKRVLTPQPEATTETELPLPQQDISIPNPEKPLEDAQKNTVTTSNPTLPVKTLDLNDERYMTAFEKTPRFSGYKIALPQGHHLEGVVLTGTSLRPSNLFFNALGLQTTLPGSGQLFAFEDNHEKIRKLCKDHDSDNPKGVVAFSAQNILANVKVNDKISLFENLAEIYGTNTYRMSHKEIQDTLDSQKIYVASSFPLPFYQGLKKAMKLDSMVILPGNDSYPYLLADLNSSKYPTLSEFLSAVDANYSKYGFTSHQQFEDIMKLTLYQLGSQVVKSEVFRIFVDGYGKIIERQPGTNDAIRLLNACGIRGITSHKTPQEINKALMTETFKTSLLAAEKGIVIMPAVGMGVWRGNPDLYWRAFLDATVSSSDNLEAIFVNPGHQASAYGKYQGCKGEEFQQILNEYRNRYHNDIPTMNKLNKITNLFDSQKDIVQLAHNLKLAYPDKIISLFNASDPDVTLGYHVGEYVNNMPHTTTTEENYTAMGTNGLCFEGITGVHDGNDRIFQCP